MHCAIATLPPAARPLLPAVRRPDELATLALAGVIGQGLATGRRPLIRGLSDARFEKLANEYFFDAELENGCAPGAARLAGDEFDDLVALLLDHRAVPDERAAWLCYAIATAAMGENHLWQDMGLPSRNALSDLLREGFPSLAARNDRNMKWKKFFYRQLCERAGVPICKAPHCAECCDFAVCFGPEG
jgi:nitrogen fixation protein NifQ